jgi:transposase
MSQIFEISLDIPDVTIEKVETTQKGDMVITVRSTVIGTHCHQCGQEIIKFYGHDRAIMLRHLPILGRKTYIRLRPVRYQCLSCRNKPTTTQKCSWYSPRASTTHLYEEHVLLQAINSTVYDVSMKEDVGYEAIMGIIDRHIDCEIDWHQYTHLDIIGLDEISLKKGHKNYVTIVTARIDKETIVLGVLKDRKKDTVKAFLSGIPQHLRKTVHSICSEMYDGVIYADKEVFGKRIKIVIDRFHVAKLYRSGLDTLRKQELRRLKQALSEEDYKQLKGVMWALRKAESDLDDKEDDLLARLFEHSPDLELAYDFCQELTHIFNQHVTKRKAKHNLKDWMKRVRASELNCFKSFLTTLETWLDEITNYFISRLTSGFVEGLNNKIKVLKRRCYGIVNTRHLFQHIHLDLAGYSLFSSKFNEL